MSNESSVHLFRTASPLTTEPTVKIVVEKKSCYCSICETYFNNLARHKREMHNIGQRDKLTCKHCHKEFGRKYDLEKKHVCRL